MLDSVFVFSSMRKIAGDAGGSGLANLLTQKTVFR